MSKPASSSSFLRDNIEAFAVAIAMALVIRHFCLEAFRIPTGSMRPTLLGDEMLPTGERLHGDRILVDKFVYLRRDPRRYEVVVFRYPLNANKNFIKRVVGIGGEWLRIAGGDIWTSKDEGETWEIARKPDGVREQLLIPYYPRPASDPAGFQGLTNWTPGPGWTANEPEREFRVDAGDERTDLVFARQVLGYDQVDTSAYGGSSADAVGDIEITFDVDVERAGRLDVVITERGVEHVLRLGDDKSVLVIGGEKPHEVDLDFRVKAGESYSISFANVDDEIHLDLDGEDRVVRFPHTPTEPPADLEWSDSGDKRTGVALRARGLKALVTDIALRRDVAYQNRGHRGHWEIPEGHFFVLGDNTASSKDSREWYISSATLKSGETIRWEAGGDPGEPRNPHAPTVSPDEVITIWRDINGITRRFRGGEVEDDDQSVPYSFVPRSHLIGRAFAVFWPIYVPPAYNGPTRVKLIR